ncbi:MAG: hypothetical protein ACKVOP_11320 [Sphingomonadaceae bacterium]
MIDLTQLYAACILSLASEQEYGEMSGPSIQLMERVSQAIEIPNNQFRFAEALNLLEEFEVATAYAHDEMPIYYKIYAQVGERNFGLSSATLQRLYRIGLRYDDERNFAVLEAFVDLGNSWLRDAIEASRDSIQLDFEKHSSGIQESDGIAFASDRLVSFNHNDAQVKEIDQTLSAIEEQICTSNEVGSALGNYREVAKIEIGGLRQMLAAGIGRASTLLSQSQRALAWLGKKVADTSVAELVKHAAKLFLDWLT